MKPLSSTVLAALAFLLLRDVEAQLHPDIVAVVEVVGANPGKISVL